MDPLQQLFDAAKAAQARAYAPYSRYPVGAALRGASGALYSGCNVENAASPVGTCAEAGAIAAMVIAGETRIIDIVVVGGDNAFITPCGACRQRIHEFATTETRLHGVDASGRKTVHGIADLLPLAFGPESLGRIRKHGD